MPASVTFDRSPQGLVGCTIALAPGMFVGAFGDGLLDALHGAAHMASSMADILNANPALQAVLPPGAGLAFRAIAAASHAAKTGASIRQVADKHGPKVATLVAQLLQAFQAQGGTP